MKIMLDETMEKLKSTKPTEDGTISGVASYDILANPDYQQAFQYVPVSVPNRSLMIQDDDEDESNDEIQCDVVRIALNLAMQSEQRTQNMSFEKDKLVEEYNSSKAGASSKV